ncbi:MAG TPA: M23 family metallopeptidase [Longimicrobiales bacterium]|nr:M23 family metallopeptidase [Longimicrobiales bacterium]
MSGPPEGRTLTVILVPDGALESRTLRISYRTLRVLAALGAAVALALTVMAGSWWYLAARASRAAELRREVDVMSRDRERIAALVQRLETIEGQYARIRSLFGSAPTDALSDVWLPPATTAARDSDGEERPQVGPTLPRTWPLTERGFVTRGLHEGLEGEHPGLDIAVPTDSYIRAAGGGTVIDVGEDAVYGRYVVIDHGSGYATLYGHASMNLVTLGEQVRERQVIALSGSTGRSTGPHLHFEVLVNGEPVDPLTVVQQPT